MAIQFPNMFYVDVGRGPATQQLNPMFLGDALSNRIGVYLYQNGVALEPGGSCFGKAVLGNGATVPIESGVVSGNSIYIDLPSGCYSVEGPIKITVVWTDNTTTTTVLEGYSNVRLTESGTVIDPGTIIPSVAALIEAINEAVESIPEDYSTLSGMVDAMTHVDLTETGYINGSGAEVSQSNYHRTGYIPVNSDSVLVLDGFFVGSTSGSAYAYYFYTADKTPISGANGITSRTVVDTIPSTAAYVRFSSRIDQGENPIAYVSNHVVENIIVANTRIALLESVVGDSQGFTPAQLAEIAGSGNADRFFSVGDIITIPWTDRSGETAVEYQVPFVIVDVADAYDSNAVKHEKAIWLQALRAIPQEMIFHAADRTEVDLSTETAAVSGWAYVGLTGTTYTALNLSAGDPIPTTYDAVYKTTYTGIALAAVQNGVARWKDSDIRQWLNSTAAKNAGWWTSQYNGATAPAAEYANLPGVLGGFSAEWQAVFKAPKVTVTLSLDGGTTTIYDYTYDKVFLPTKANVYASSASEGDPYWAYWVSAVGGSSPSTSKSAARVLTPMDSNSATAWWSCKNRNASNMGDANYFKTDGGMSYGSARTYRRAAPCVCIF